MGPTADLAIVTQPLFEEEPTLTLPSPHLTQTQELVFLETQQILPSVTYTVSATPESTSTPDTRLEPNYWPRWPVVPVVSPNVIHIYQRGIEMGRDPTHFSKVGDRQSQPAVFFCLINTVDRYYLSEGYEHLQETIDQFRGSFARESLAVEDGFGVTSVLLPIWANPELCEVNESPLACEIRLHSPSIIIISLGTNWKPDAERTFDDKLREIVKYTIEQGAVPILVTKADNIEGDNSLDAIIAQVAYDYDVPLWNFWNTVQHLPNHGLDQEKKGGLTYLIVEAWNIKTFSGLRALDAVWRTVNGN
jgi:hypothetical protein